MKKRHEQKLILLSITLAALFNVPLILVFDRNDAILGFPVSYFIIFSIWIGVVAISYVILRNHYE